MRSMQLQVKTVSAVPVDGSSDAFEQDDRRRVAAGNHVTIFKTVLELTPFSPNAVGN